MNKLFKIFAAAAILFSAACTTDHGKYAVVSSGPMSLYNLAANNEVVAEQVSNSEHQFGIFFIPFNSQPKIDDIIEKTVRKYQGDYMSNVNIEYRTFSLLAFYQHKTWTVTGDVVRVHK